MPANITYRMDFSDRTELIIDFEDGRELKLTTAEVDELIHELMQNRIHMLPQLEVDD